MALAPGWLGVGGAGGVPGRRLTMEAATVRSLYVHVPFCAHKCEYCAFYSHGVEGVLVDRYVTALTRELGWVASGLKPRTVFFGGGTPSILTMRQWSEVLGAFDRLGLLGAEEWTVECNPATVSMDKARLWRDYGVNRVSLGVQSLDERLLDRLGRVHSREMAVRSYELLRRAGFERVNVDLMFAIPGQTLEVWRATLGEVLAWGSEHVSSYEVTYEEDTPLYAAMRAGEFDVDEDLACALYEELRERAAGAGWEQYEVSNFARRRVGEYGELPGEACAHNVNYWRGGEFRGLGPSASEYVAGVRTRNWANTALYCDQVEKGQRAIESRDELSRLARAGEVAAFGLRMNVGWGFKEFEAVTGYDLRQRWREEMRGLVECGWGRYAPEGRDRPRARGCRVTAAGMRGADAAGERFLVVG